MKCSPVLFLATLVTLAATSAFSTLLYYDGFPTNGANAYTVGQLSSGINPQHSTIVGFKDNTANTWQAGSSAIRISANSLATPADIKLTAQDGCFSVGESSGSPRAGYRNMVVPALSGTTYYSFLIKYKGSFPSALTHDGVAFDTVGFSGTSNAAVDKLGTNGFVVAFLRQDASVVNLVLLTPTATNNLVANASAGGTYMVAVKYVNNPGAAHEIYASVITQPQEPTTWDVSITTPVRSSTINKMCIGGYGANSTATCFLFDEIRMGTTFQDVAGVAGAEPAVFSGNTSVSSVSVGESNGSATFTGALSDPGSPIADLYLYWGATDGGVSDSASWANTGFVAQASAATFSTNVVTLPAQSMVFYRLAAVTASQTIWGVPEPPSFLTAPLTVVSPGPVAENALSPVSFVISRPSTNAACTASLKVNFVLGGTAQYGVHYTASSTNSVTIPALASSANVSIQPIPDFASSTERVVTLAVESGAYVSSASVTGVLTLANVSVPPAPTNAFIGASSSLASVPGNWSLGHVPTAGEDILFSPTFARSPLIWDPLAPTTVASWTQPSVNTNTVFFETTLNAPLQILGDVALNGGVWTHTGPSNAPVYAVAVDIGGDLNIGSNAAINVGRDIDGIDPGGNTRGFYRAGPGYLSDTGSSYGGAGFTNTVTYGSVINPLSYGSGARGGGGAAALLKYSGGGLVRIRVSGTVAVSGKIAADGYGYANNGGGGSGGTLNLQAGKLIGSGSISANGGTDTYFGPGAGGRIRIKLTGLNSAPSDFSGTLTAYGAPGGAPGALGQYDTAGAAAGTIAFGTSDMDTGVATVWVRNHDNWRAMTNTVYQFTPATHLPPKQDTDPSLKLTRWVLGDNAKVRLTKNVTVASLAMSPAVSPNAVRPVLYLDGYSLSVLRLEVNGASYPIGTYAAGVFPSGWVVGLGSITVQGAGTFIRIY